MKHNARLPFPSHRERRLRTLQLLRTKTPDSCHSRAIRQCRWPKNCLDTNPCCGTWGRTHRHGRGLRYHEPRARLVRNGLVPIVDHNGRRLRPTRSFFDVRRRGIATVGGVFNLDGAWNARLCISAHCFGRIEQSGEWSRIVKKSTPSVLQSMIQSRATTKK